MSKKKSGGRTPSGRQDNPSFNKKKSSVKDRTSRNAARRAAVKKFGAAAVKGKDVIHKDGNPRNNSPSNLGLASRSKNRSFSRNKKAGKKDKKA